MPAKKTGLVATPPPIGGGIFSPRTEGPAGRAVWICSEDDGQGGCAEEGAVFWRLAHVGMCERELLNLRMCTRFGELVCVCVYVCVCACARVCVRVCVLACVRASVKECLREGERDNTRESACIRAVCGYTQTAQLYPTVHHTRLP